LQSRFFGFVFCGWEKVMDDYRCMLRKCFPLWMGYLVGCQVMPQQIPIETREVALHHRKARIFSPSGVIAAPAPVFQDSDAAYASGASYEYAGGAKTFAVGRRASMPLPVPAVSAALPMATSTAVAVSSTSTSAMPPISAAAVSAPEVSRDRSSSDTTSSLKGTHSVAKGETLYAVSRQYGVSVEELARANALSPPYILSEGQKLTLSNNRLSKRSMDVKEMSMASQSVQIAENNHKSTENHLKETQQIHRLQKARRFNIEWSWPNNGSVISKFSVNGNKGIDIRGEMGEAVHAAASGKVVYSGNGLRGYGNMIIVQHDNGYLTAYAHNSKLLVSEGNFVKAGQKIAEIGSSEAEISKLHFEIRKDGNPVDPIDYLPARAR
jgi:lipoprotein NlpD